jgi:hypothetical protein
MWLFVGGEKKKKIDPTTVPVPQHPTPDYGTGTVGCRYRTVIGDQRERLLDGRTDALAERNTDPYLRRFHPRLFKGAVNNFLYSPWECL